MVSTSSFLTGLKTEGVDAEATPNVMLGAASPLWLMFGGAAMAGATWWWWRNRWRESVNLEALMAFTPEPVAPLTPAALEAVTATAPAPSLFDALPSPTPETVPDLLAETPQAEAVAEEVLEAAVTVEEPLAKTPEAGAATDVAAEVLQAGEDVAETLIEAAAETIELTAEPLAEVADAATVIGDDLTRLVGIGPKLAAALADRGVTAFAQIAAWGDVELAEVDKALDLKGRAARDAWVAQAKRLAEGSAA